MCFANTVVGFQPEKYFSGGSLSNVSKPIGQYAVCVRKGPNAFFGKFMKNDVK